MKRLTRGKTAKYAAISLILFIVLALPVKFFPAASFDLQTHYITILHTNDVHGRLEPFKYRDNKELVGGLARRAGLISAIEAANRNVITLDAGDFAQGTMFFNLFGGEPDVEMMHMAGYDAGTLGNHEFDKGLNNLKNIIKTSGYPFVAANIRFTNDAELQSLVKPYIIRNQHGLKTAIIGLVPKELKTLVNVSDGIEVLDPIETTRKIVEEVNPKVGLIIVVAHQGLDEDLKLAESVPEIDVIVGGHSHTLLRKPKVLDVTGDKTVIVQTGEFGQYLGRLDLKVRDKKIQNYHYQLIPVNNDVPYNSAYVKINEYVSQYAEEVKNYGKQKAGQLATTIGNDGEKAKTGLTVTGGLVTEAIKHRFPQVDVVLQNSGGIRLRRTVGPGEITVGDVMELYPFENQIVILELKGSDLKSVLEHSARVYPRPNDAFLQSVGLEYTIDSAKPPQKLSDDGLTILSEGNRVFDIKVGGAPLDNDKYYKVAVNDYIFNGGNGFSQFKNSINVINTGLLVSDIVCDYVKQNSPVSVEVKDKINYK